MVPGCSNSGTAVASPVSHDSGAGRTHGGGFSTSSGKGDFVLSRRRWGTRPIIPPSDCWGRQLNLGFEISHPFAKSCERMGHGRERMRRGAVVPCVRVGRPALQPVRRPALQMSEERSYDFGYGASDFCRARRSASTTAFITPASAKKCTRSEVRAPRGSSDSSEGSEFDAREGAVSGASKGR